MKRIVLSAAIGVALLLSGCSSPCATYCSAWDQCINNDVDVGRCEERCQSWADESERNTARVEECGQCIGDTNTCSETTDRCFDDCLFIPGP